MRPQDAFAHTGVARAPLPRRSLRLWSVRHAAGLAKFYTWFERVLQSLDPLFRRIGYARLERPVAIVERAVKSTLFDCRMCGQCVLSATGLACPMNCPKGLRNGPCGGVRDNGNCEVHEAMPCVWVQSYHGAQRMGTVARLAEPLPPVDQRKAGRSSWLQAAQANRRAAP
jgi:Methylene-tetrahydrofolate reductase C terminal